MTTGTEPTLMRWRNGARVSRNTELLHQRLCLSLALETRERLRPKSHPDGIELARSRPNKSWAKRYLRARGLPL